MRLSVKARWILLALAGLLVALAVAVAASKLTSQRIGLASEPLQAGQDLAPTLSQGHQAGGGRPHGGRPNRNQDDRSSPPPATTTAAPTTSTPTAATTEPSDDSASESSGSEGADD